ncbi:MAG: 2-amino-4-hydroxy-6-hydroxymethyldihydropteridine diphosphokinase [Xanthobacteraceae bacterium]
MAEATLGLGGNVGDVRHTLDRAVEMLCDGIDTTLIARSSEYLTPPWGVTDQPEFVNMCILVDTALSPRALLERMRTIEVALGRDRSAEVRWGPRPIDIDLLTYGDAVLSEPELTLPHPRILERAFVLVPLAEIAPDLIVDKTRVRDAVSLVDTREIRKLPPQLSELM